MENNKEQLAKEPKNIDSLEEKIKKLNGENMTFMPWKNSLPAATIIIVFLVLAVLGGIVYIVLGMVNDKSDLEFRIILFSSLFLIVSIISFWGYKVITLVISRDQQALDTKLSIYKEREMLVINLRKSLANKVLDSITLEDKKDGSAESEKQDESECLKVKEKYEHEERMAIIKALGVDCDKKSIDTIHLKLVEIEKALKQ